MDIHESFVKLLKSPFCPRFFFVWALDSYGPHITQRAQESSRFFVQFNLVIFIPAMTDFWWKLRPTGWLLNLRGDH